MLTSDHIDACRDFLSGPGEVRVRSRSAAPPDTLFPIPVGGGHFTMFSRDCAAAAQGRMKMVSVWRNGDVHIGTYAVTTPVASQRAVARDNLERLRAELLTAYWNAFRSRRAAALGLVGPAAKRERHKLNASAPDPHDRTPEALRRRFSQQAFAGIFEELSGLEKALAATDAEIGALR